MTAVRREVLSRVRRYWPECQAQGAVHRVRPTLVAAVICQESLGHPYAQRVELGFWRRYLGGILRLVKATVSRDDDKWARYPEIASSSYGLMQVLYIVALEHGVTLQYPGELFEPHLNIRVGTKHLAGKIKARGGDMRQGLLGYNGGGDPAYPDKVLAWEKDILSTGLFPQ